MTTSPNVPTPARDDQLKRLAVLIAGMQKHEQELAPFVIADKQYAVADIIAALQARYNATQAVITTKAVWQAAVKADHEGRASGQVFYAGVRSTLLVAFASSVNKLADFGLVGRKSRIVSPETKVATTAKIKATRVARHTMGKKQKAQIHGTVSATTPIASISAPVAAPAAATVPTAPEPSAVAVPVTSPPHS
jgi:hypothetical protein